MIETVTTIASILINGIPKLVELIKAGKNAKDVKLGDFMSNDAVKSIEGSIEKSKSFEDKFG